MRHRKDHRKLSRTHSHRRALLRNLVTSLIQHERIETTLAKAKEARRVGERMITFAKRGDLSARRHVARYVHGPENVRKLFETVAPWYATRQGGYTRILKLGRRLGDAGEMALLEFVKSPELKEKLRKDEEAAAREKAKAGKAAPSRGGRGRPRAKEPRPGRARPTRRRPAARRRPRSRSPNAPARASAVSRLRRPARRAGGSGGSRASSA